jgi:AcrR family transcriptional regulator
MRAVADAAGVGMSALYRIFGDRNGMVGAVASVDMRKYIDEAERALEAAGDPLDNYIVFLERILAADTHAIVLRLAGTFTPQAEQWELGNRVGWLNRELFVRAAATGRIRDGVTELDIAHALDLLSHRVLEDEGRSLEVRLRILRLIIDGMTVEAAPPLPHRPPSDEEWTARWN